MKNLKIELIWRENVYINVEDVNILVENSCHTHTPYKDVQYIFYKVYGMMKNKSEMPDLVLGYKGEISKDDLISILTEELDNYNIYEEKVINGYMTYIKLTRETLVVALEK